MARVGTDHCVGERQRHLGLVADLQRAEHALLDLGCEQQHAAQGAMRMRGGPRGPCLPACLPAVGTWWSGVWGVMLPWVANVRRRRRKVASPGEGAPPEGRGAAPKKPLCWSVMALTWQPHT